VPYSGTTTLNVDTVAFEIICPRKANRIIITPADDITVGYAGEDAAALVGGVLQLANFTVEWDLPKTKRQAHPILPPTSIFLQTLTQPTVVNIQLLV
jgi:hypothetical protein